MLNQGGLHFGLLLDVLQELGGRVVRPVVEFAVGALDVGGGHLGRIVFVQSVVLLLVFQLLQAVFLPVHEQLAEYSGLLLLLILSLLLLTLRVLLDNPDTSSAKQRAQFRTHSGQEISVIKVQYLVDRILELHSHQPNLLVLDKAARTLIHAILSKCFRE